MHILNTPQHQQHFYHSHVHLTGLSFCNSLSQIQKGLLYGNLYFSNIVKASLISTKNMYQLTTILLPTTGMCTMEV